MAEEALTIIEPTDADLGEKLRDENRGRDSLYSHFIYPLGSLTVGMTIALALVEFGPLLMRSNPILTLMAVISFGLFLGVLYAGLRVLKPEHHAINLHTAKAQRKNYWTLLVKTQNVDIPREAIREEIRYTQYESVN